MKAVEDIEECACIWKKYIEASSIFDLWDIRKCFSDSFQRNNDFLILENDGEVQGILPLSWIEESGFYSFFPGESWSGKTWLEQNKAYACDNNAFQILIDNAPGPIHIRYMCANSLYFNESLTVDEINYHLYPGEYNYSFDQYMQKFSGKSRKNLSKEIDKFYAQGALIRYNKLEDIDTLFEMNLSAFGEHSYFTDNRFFNSFESLIKYLWDKNMLRITTVTVGEKTAAVDIGTVYNKEYVVLAGGTNPEFTGIAKLINFHHIEWASNNKFDKIDFLCGDFGWKERFHLSSKPLYEIKLHTAKEIPLEHVKDRTGTYGC
ncbi:MAG: hypothetical protein A2X47_13200 [Lentisphaerae bacterium GWF2_38_69]|nr:MAG: hypothetical protein A2X47_13200 [Lentisphaerae bacterium GWF2_38_69]